MMETDTINPHFSVPTAAMEVLACPRCQGGLIWASLQHEAMACRYCKVTYPQIDGILYLRPEDAIEKDFGA